jgi:hypothetical protein
MLNDYLHYMATISETPWRSWLKHCATSEKIAASFPGGVIGYGDDSACHRNECQENLLLVKVAGA